MGRNFHSISKRISLIAIVILTRLRSLFDRKGQIIDMMILSSQEWLTKWIPLIFIGNEPYDNMNRNLFLKKAVSSEYNETR